ncbi:phosphotransferase family protein [Allopontixanthobacter sediminis]|uniref:Phosphotransferase n=1 Tax=Allopontixanthobacter sediminis TaxID=1689985 RepID=A0A845B4L8_9SPHN|nr:phosphotransferase family protein [Allopontixanthobacter sediminis]MXP45348.1 phosphotransferase [Allopontixanthobacter sediminis]
MSDTASRFARWAQEQAGIDEAVIGQTLTGGNANVTRLVDTAQGQMVLRHPPADTVSALAGAGIEREYRFLEALGGKAPVANPIAWCGDSAVLGVPFSLTGFVHGVSITEDLPVSYQDSIETRSSIGAALIAALASIHVIDPEGLGLGDPDKARSFVRRQVTRWRDVRRKDQVRVLPQIDKIAAWLLTNCPDPQAIRIVHCDYHLDNTLMDETALKVNAILDWEMATLADPMVDLGLVTALWNRDEDGPLGFRFVQRISNRGGVVSGSELAAQWAQTTELSIAQLQYYQVFALWRLAAIVEGAFVLYRKGQVDGAYERGLEQDVPALLSAADLLTRTGVTA